MRKRFSILIGGFLAVLMIAGAVTASVVYAQDATPPPSDSAADTRPLKGGRGLSQAELEAAAKALNMTTDELSSALEAGKTLEDLATAAGVDIQVVQDTLSAVRAEEMRAQIAAGVADGSISQEKADWLLEGLDKGFLDDGHAFGIGIDRGPGRGGSDDGMGHRPLSAAALAAAAEALGMSTTDLQTALEAGTSLQSLAEQVGVEYDTVMNAIRSTMPEHPGQRP